MAPDWPFFSAAGHRERMQVTVRGHGSPADPVLVYTIHLVDVVSYCSGRGKGVAYLVDFMSVAGTTSAGMLRYSLRYSMPASVRNQYRFLQAYRHVTYSLLSKDCIALIT